MNKVNVTCTHCGADYSSVHFTFVCNRYFGICPACQNDLAMALLSERLNKLERKAQRLRVTYQPNVEAMREALALLAAKSDVRDMVALAPQPKGACPTCGGERVRRPFQACPNDAFHCPEEA